MKDRCRIKYDNSVLQLFRVDQKGEDTYDKIYFPFYIALIGNSIHVLNCNRGFRFESQIKKDINPITIVVPHILNYTMGQQSNNGRKPFVITRPKEIPQNNNLTESAVMTVLLIRAHALNRIDGCQEVKEAHLAAAAKHLAVLIYRDINPA